MIGLLVLQMKKGKTTTPPPQVQLDKPLDIAEIKTEKAVEIREIVQGLKKRVSNMRKSPEKYSVARLDELVNEIDDLVRTKRHELDVSSSASQLKMNGRQIMVQLADLNQSISEDISSDERKSLQEMKKELDRYLPIILNKEVFQWFLGEVGKLRSDIDVIRPTIETSEKKNQSMEQDAQLRRHIAALKGYEDVSMLKGDIMKQAELGTRIPKTTRELLFHPVWLSRKLEKEFTCIVDKSRDVHSKSDGCYIAGTARDVDACISKLETMDVCSGKKHILLDGRTLSQVMGVGGSNAFEIEKDCNVFLFAPSGGVELTIYGSEKAVEKAMTRIGQHGVESASNVNITSDRIRCNTAVAKAFQSLGSSVEEKCGVSITLSPVVEDARESWVIVRGLADSVARGIHEIQVSIKNLHLETIDVVDLFNSPDAAKSAIDRVLCQQGTTTRKGFGEVKLAIRFNDLKKRAVFCRASDSSTEIDCVCMAGEQDAVIGDFQEIVKQSIFETEKIDIKREHSRCWNEAMTSLVASIARGKGGDADQLSIFFKRSSSSDEFWLELWGSEISKSNAVRIIEEVHDAKIVIVPEEAIRPMLENKCQVLQSIQEEVTVSAYFSKLDNELWFYGLDANKGLAKKMFDDFVQSVRDAQLQHTVKSIPIASDEIGRLIGPRGKTMNGIKDRAQLEEIRISELDKKVYITGTNLSVDHAISLIEEELSARKDATVVQIGLGEDEETCELLKASGSASNQNNTAGTTGLLSNKTNEWVVSKSEHSMPQEPIAVESQDLFPSLGDGLASKTATAKPKWKKRV